MYEDLILVQLKRIADSLEKIADNKGTDPLENIADSKEKDEKLSRLGDWVLEYGENLKPTAGSADTFGDGMRAAKSQVKNILFKENKK